VNITVLDSEGKNVRVPMGDRFAKFSTIKGHTVTSLGVIFDFTGNAQNTTVQFAEDMLKEKWFAEAIADEPDLFLLVGVIFMSQWGKVTPRRTVLRLVSRSCK